ncbi:MAG: 4-hydroxythreonine-4-phosphate dehydrogenase PdxA [Pseudomonadota bacterium]
MKTQVPPLVLTQGDPAGIGPDITALAWQSLRENAAFSFCVVGSAQLIADRVDRLGLNIPIASIGHAGEAAATFAHALPILDNGTTAPVTPGQPDATHAAGVIEAVRIGAERVMSGEASALVTNPIAKHVLYSAGFDHPGHTEFLAELTAESGVLGPDSEPPHPVMMLAAPSLRVVPATVHVPVTAVPGLLSRALLLKTCRIVARDMAKSFACPNPRLVLAGLNPHAGEHGSLGHEERDIIAPVVAKLRAEGVDIRGPLPADTLFHDKARTTYDVAIAMYHDQALIPIKTIAFDRAVNVTLGLPFVRTSPDHGTAFDIAGSGTASPDSLIAALNMAAELAANRRRAMKQ